MKKKKAVRALLNAVDSIHDPGLLQATLMFELLNSMGTSDPSEAVQGVLDLLEEIAPEIGVILVLNRKPTTH